MRIVVLQHVAFEGPGQIADWVEQRGHSRRTVRLFAGERVPTVDQFDGLVMMGGPMSVNEEGRFGWLRPEKQLVAAAIALGKPVLGVCLGAQMIASALGAKVYANPEREIGWLPVRQTAGVRGSPLADLPAEFRAFHWHGETFHIPPTGTLLASTEGCVNQAFAVGSGLGLQFHLEVSEESLAAMVKHGGQEIGTGRYEQAAAVILAGKDQCRKLKAGLFGVLDRWART